MKRAAGLLVLGLLLACGGDTPAEPGPASGPGGGGRDGGGGSADGGSTPDNPRGDLLPDGGRGPDHPPNVVRLMAANLTSGNGQSYDPGEGIRIFQGLRPDIALVQETNYRNNTGPDLASFVATAFGADYTFYREPDVDIPNAVVSRFPITASGRWEDPEVQNRGFAWAKIAVPGPHPLWAVSVHLLTTGSTNRNEEATSLVGQLGAVVAEGDYVVVGGDLNTDSRREPCLTTLAAFVETTTPFPADQAGNDATNRTRSKPYDWLLVSPGLRQHQVPTTIGAGRFAAGLVFDSRVFTPLADVPPILKTDSDATNMQHMAVLKDFDLATP